MVICPLYHQEVGFVDMQRHMRAHRHTHLEELAARSAAGNPRAPFSSVLEYKSCCH